MATVTSLEATRILELAAGWEGVFEQQTETKASVSQLVASLEAHTVNLLEFNQVTLPALNVNLSANSVVVGALAGKFPIAAEDIAANTITANEILADTITANEIAAGTITAAEIAADTITANEIAAGTITAAELAADAITTNHLISGTILAEAIDAIGLSASWIRSGFINSDRVSIGSKPVSVVHNANMEDPFVELDGTVLWDKFAGWTESIYYNGAGSSISEASTPISGGRSIRLVLPTSADGQRIVTTHQYPVTAGQMWVLSAKYKLDKSINKADPLTTLGNGNKLLGLMFHTAETGFDPALADTSTDTTPGTIQWQEVDAVDISNVDQIITLQGTVVVPENHRLMCVSVSVGPSDLLDGTGYAATIDEVQVVPASAGLSIVTPSGETYGVNEEGDATFHDLSVSGELALDSSTDTLDGLPLGNVLGEFSSGLIARGQRGGFAGTTLPLAWTHVMTVELELLVARHVFVNANQTVESGTANARYNAEFRHTYSAPGVGSPAEPTSTSAFVPGSNVFSYATGVANKDSTRVSSFVSNYLPAGIYKIALFIRAIDAALIARTDVPGPQMSILDMGTVEFPNKGYWADSPAPGETVYVKTYNATTTKWWSGGGTHKGSGLTQYFGNTSATGEGNRKSCMWFDDTQIRADIGAGTVDKVELYMYLVDGGDNQHVAIGRHTSSTPGSNIYPGGNRQLFTVNGWDEGSAKWVDVTSVSGLSNWATTLRGYIIGPESSDADSYAASYRGVGSSLVAKVRITYRK